MAPNINNPGGVKNDPDEIRDAVVSDSTRFPGGAVPSTGTIPNTNQVGQGVNWKTKTPKFATAEDAGGGGGQTLLNISGSGYLMSISVSNADSQDTSLKVTIDGVVRRSGSLAVSGSDSATFAMIHRFDSQLKIEEEGFDAAQWRFGYVLD